jgi:hypothetical protein
MPNITTTEQNPARLQPIVMPTAAAVPSQGDWRDRGLCIGADPDTFFPSHGAPGTEAREICASCAVREDCLEYATEADEFGIWGGLNQGERRSLERRQRRRRTAARATAWTADTPRGDEGAA